MKDDLIEVKPDTDQDRSWQILARQQVERTLERAVVEAAVAWAEDPGGAEDDILVCAVDALQSHREAR